MLAKLCKISSVMLYCEECSSIVLIFFDNWPVNSSVLSFSVVSPFFAFFFISTGFGVLN